MFLQQAFHTAAGVTLPGVVVLEELTLFLQMYGSRLLHDSASKFLLEFRKPQSDSIIEVEVGGIPVQQHTINPHYE